MTIDQNRIEQFNQLALSKEEYEYLRNLFDDIYGYKCLGECHD